MTDIRDRYNNDTTFRTCVDAMVGMLINSMLTTHDIAQAAVLAAQIYAERHCAPITVILDDRRLDPY